MLGRSHALALLTSCSLALFGLFAACGSDETSSNDDDDNDTSDTGGSGGSSSGSGASSSGSGASSSSSSGSGTGGAMGCAGLGDACSDCAFGACNALYCTCYDNPACGALVACAQTCAPGDTGCAQNCLTQNQAGISDALLLGNCAAGGCAADCPTATVLSPCESCAFTNCEQQMNTCLANAECTALIECVQGCSDGDDICLAGCAIEHGDGQNDAEAVQNCVASPCPECG